MYELIGNVYNFMIVVQIPIVLLLVLLYLVYTFLTIAIAYVKDAYPYKFPTLLDKYLDWGEAGKPVELLAAALSGTLVLGAFGIVAAISCIVWPVLWIYVFLLWLRHKDRQHRVGTYENEEQEEENDTGRKHHTGI